jgi:hypothetical protein
MMLKKIDVVGSVGEATFTVDGDTIISIKIGLEGTLQSYRAKELQSRHTQCRERKIREAGGQWLQKILSLGVRSYLVSLQRQCGLVGVCISLEASISRKRNIRDFKDLIAGFDHMILDPLVRAGILIDDDYGNLEWMATQVDGTAPKGPDYINLTFKPATIPCRKSVTRQILEFGWPDAEFRNRRKDERRKEIKERLKNVHSKS